MAEIVKGRLVKSWGDREPGSLVEVDAVRFAAMSERGEIEAAGGPESDEPAKPDAAIGSGRKSRRNSVATPGDGIGAEV